MDRIDRIIKNREFARLVGEIEELEKDRIFCHHDMAHFLDVARIAALMAADEGLQTDREMIYAAALLHDTGRGRQYTEGIAHEAASAEIAPAILKDAGFSPEEIALITEAIRQHGNEDIKDRADLTGLIYRADKASRRCYMCKAIDKCHKRADKLVMNVKY